MAEIFSEPVVGWEPVVELDEVKFGHEYSFLTTKFAVGTGVCYVRKFVQACAFYCGLHGADVRSV